MILKNEREARMAYARLGQDGSDVYVYLGSDRKGKNYLTCAFCHLKTAVHETMTGDPRYWCTQGMIDHLRDHDTEGDHVPSYVIPELMADDLENFGTKPDQVS